jgi:hypothetical protein
MDKMKSHKAETTRHIHEVQQNLRLLMRELRARAKVHDASKLVTPEAEILAENNPKLAQVEYGSPEYEALLQEVKPALDHHYANNRHHPQHWPEGVDDMDLVDVVEMLADWIAATKRNKNGNIHKSIEHNTTRFHLSPQLAKILENTVNRYF